MAVVFNELVARNAFERVYGRMVEVKEMEEERARKIEKIGMGLKMVANRMENKRRGFLDHVFSVLMGLYSVYLM
jgi:hypothetical protein